MKILFCGQLRSPFILNDYEILQTKFNVDLINMDIVQFTRKNIINYIIYILTTGAKKVAESDIVYIWVADYPAFPLILLSKLFNKKCVLIIGGWEVANYPEIQYGNQMNIVRGAITRWCIRNSNINIIPSNIYKYITLAIEPDINIMVVANTIKPESHSITKRDKVITALFVLNNHTSLLKGIETFKNAAERLSYECKVYDGLSHEDLMKVLREAKVYCQLSYTESFGVTNLEAMACGCVPVVTDRGALPEIIGNCGIIVPYGDINATVDAIKLAMNMNGGAAIERAKMFTNDQRLDTLTKIFDNLMEPLVSIVIPSYNSSQWLIETIASVTMQTYKNIEIIIVDDCSTDDTKELVASMMKSDDRIRYIQNIRNMGECISSRIGFAHANGDYICRLSSDDMWVNINKLKHQVQIMKNMNADWSYNAINCTGNSIFENKEVKSYWMTIPTRYGYKFANILQLFDNIILRFPRIAFLMMFLRGNPVNSSTLMFNRSSYMNNEQWSNQHRTDCDGLLLYKSLLKGLRGVAIFEMGALYRTHPNQMSYNPDYLVEMKVIRKEVIDEAINGDYPLWLRLICKCIRKFK